MPFSAYALDKLQSRRLRAAIEVAWTRHEVQATEARGGRIADRLAELKMQTDDLRHIVQTFDPDRLRIAREASELLQRELAQQIEVSAAAVSQYEHGHARPSPHTLQQIAEHLGYPVEFFAGDRPLDEAEAAAGFFRKLARAPARSRQQAKVLPLLLPRLSHFRVTVSCQYPVKLRMPVQAR